MWFLIPILFFAGGCSYHYERKRSMSREWIGAGQMQITALGTCNSDAEAKKATDSAISQLCKHGFEETSRNADAYKCVDGKFYSLLKGYCRLY